MDDIQVGMRVQELRKARGLSLRALAQKTGIAPGYLSAIERGQNSITIGKLKNLVSALGVTLSSFFADDGSGDNRVAYRRADLVQLSRDPKISILEVGSGRPDRKLQMTWEHYRPGADTGEDFYRTEADDTGLVLKGTMELTIEKEVHLLGPGDGYYYDLSRPHRIRNIGNDELEVITANAPATF